MFHIHLVYLYIACSSSLICHLSEESRALSLVNSIRSQMCDFVFVLVATAIIVSRHFNLTERGNICVYTNTCIIIYL